MKNNKPKTKVPNDYANEFLTETIPFFTANPGWRNIFNTLANLSEGGRSEMLKRLEDGTIPLGLVPGEQLSTAMAFLKLNLEDPVGPRMMIRLIDHVQKIREQSPVCGEGA